MLPVDYSPSRPSSPIFNYPYERSRQALEQLQRNSDRIQCHGIKMRFVNPASGGYTMPTIGAFMQLLPAGFSGVAYRQTDATIYVVVEGQRTDAHWRSDVRVASARHLRDAVVGAGRARGAGGCRAVQPVRSSRATERSACGASRFLSNDSMQATSLELHDDWSLMACGRERRTAPAQVDFSGEWAPRFWEDQPERVPGPELGDYLGIPISDAARLRAESWDASIQTLPEWQCRPHSADYIWRGPSPLTISKEVDPVSREIVAFHAQWLRSVDRAVYLDGRPLRRPTRFIPGRDSRRRSGMATS